MKMARNIGVTLAVGLLVGCASATPHRLAKPQRLANSTAYARAMDLFFQNKLDEALPQFTAAIRSNPGATQPLVWYAETARRLDKPTESLTAVRKALTMVPCDGFAHTVIAQVYYPQSIWDDRPSMDSTWVHLNQAVQCNPDDGNAWFLLWNEAIHRKNRKMETQALRRMWGSHFFSPSWIALNRWVLESLPRDAILVTSGDLDTYPALALQEAKAIRRDVGVVNSSMLALPWYVRHVVKRYGLPMPFSSDSLDNFQSSNDSAGNPITLARAVFDRWRALAIEGRLPRPLVVGFTTGFLQEAITTKGEYRIEGPFARVLAKREGASTLMDTAKVRASLAHLSGTSFSGPVVSPQDRSPVRHSEYPASGTPLHLALLQSQALVKAGAVNSAKRQLAWMQRFGHEAGLDSSTVAEWIESKDSLP